MVPPAPTLTAIDWQPDGPLVGIAADGTVMISSETEQWQEAGQLDGPAEALDAVDGRWHAATESGVYQSTDDGRTWQGGWFHPLHFHRVDFWILRRLGGPGRVEAWEKGATT